MKNLRSKISASLLLLTLLTLLPAGCVTKRSGAPLSRSGPVQQVRWSVRTVDNLPVNNCLIAITALDRVSTASTTNIVLGRTLTIRTGTNGLVTTNLMSQYYVMQYRSVIPFFSVDTTNFIPETNVVIDVATTLTNYVPVSSLAVWTRAESDARYVATSLGTAYNLTLKATNGPAVPGYVWTATDTNGRGYWAEAQGGGGPTGGVSLATFQAGTNTVTTNLTALMVGYDAFATNWVWTNILARMTATNYANLVTTTSLVNSATNTEHAYWNGRVSYLEAAEPFALRSDVPSTVDIDAWYLEGFDQSQFWHIKHTDGYNGASNPNLISRIGAPEVLTNKTIMNPVITGGSSSGQSISSPTIGDPTFSGTVNFGGSTVVGGFNDVGFTNSPQAIRDIGAPSDLVWLFQPIGGGLSGSSTQIARITLPKVLAASSGAVEWDYGFWNNTDLLYRRGPNTLARLDDTTNAATAAAEQALTVSTNYTRGASNGILNYIQADRDTNAAQAVSIAALASAKMSERGGTNSVFVTPAIGLQTNTVCIISNGSASGPGVAHWFRTTNGVLSHPAYQSVNLTNGEVSFPSLVASALTTNKIAVLDAAGKLINATGTADSTTFLRGDGTLAVPAGGASGLGTAAYSNVTDFASSRTAGIYPNSNTVLFFEGDSLSVAAPATWPYQFTNLHSQWRGFCNVLNIASGGTALSGMASRYAGSVYPYRPAAPTNTSILFLWAGANGINDGNTAEYHITAFSNYWTTAKADGFTLVAFTIINRNDSHGQDISHQTNRYYINNWIRKSSIPDFVVDVDKLLPDSTDLRYFDADQIHLNTTGYQLVARYVDYVLRTGSKNGPDKALAVSLQQEGTNHVVRNSRGKELLRIDDLGLATSLKGFGLLASNVTLALGFTPGGNTVSNSTVLAGWRTGVTVTYTNGTNFFSVFETNRATVIASNATTAQIDFSDAGTGQVVITNLNTAITLQLTNLVDGRDVWVDIETDGTARNITVATNGLTSLTMIAWGKGNPTNGSYAFSVTNRVTLNFRKLPNIGRVNSFYSHL